MPADAEMSGDMAIRPARLTSRIVGLVIDTILCAGGFIVGLAANDLAVTVFMDGSGGIWSLFWLWLVCPAIIGYFTVSFAGGQSLGMKGASTRLARKDSWERPGVLHAIPRALLTFSLLAAPVMLFVVSLGDPTPGSTFADIVVLGLPAVLLFLNLVNYLWMIPDSQHQTLLDHLLDLVMLETRVTTPGTNGVAISHI